MPRLVVYPASSPFRRRRGEWLYGPAGGEAHYPLAALLDQNVFPGSRGLVLVEDYYSVWPQVGALPGAGSYVELVEALEGYLARACPRLLPGPACGRVEWRVVPGTGVMGGWRFEARYPERLLGSLRAAASAAAAHRPGRLVLLVDAEADSATVVATVEAVEAAAAAAWAGLETVEAGRDPYPLPRGGPPMVRLLEGASSGPAELLRATVARAPREPPGGPVLEPAGPGRPALEPWEQLLLQAASSLMASRCLLLPLLYSGCGAADPAARLAENMERLWRGYTSATILSKRRVGGSVAHGARPSLAWIRLAAAGAAAEAAALHSLEASGSSCDSLYRDGAPRRAVEHLASLLGCSGDETPGDCVEGGRLRSGCLKRIRRLLLGGGTQS